MLKLFSSLVAGVVLLTSVPVQVANAGEIGFGDVARIVKYASMPKYCSNSEVGFIQYPTFWTALVNSSALVIEAKNGVSGSGAGIHIPITPINYYGAVYEPRLIETKTDGVTRIDITGYILWFEKLHRYRLRISYAEPVNHVSSISFGRDVLNAGGVFEPQPDGTRTCD